MPGQGSRTIRTEEAILISLAALEEKFDPIEKPKPFILSESIPQSEDTGIKQFEHKRKEPKQAIVTESPKKKFDTAAISEDLSRFD